MRWTTVSGCSFKLHPEKIETLIVNDKKETGGKNCISEKKNITFRSLKLHDQKKSFFLYF